MERAAAHRGNRRQWDVGCLAVVLALCSALVTSCLFPPAGRPRAPALPGGRPRVSTGPGDGTEDAGGPPTPSAEPIGVRSQIVAAWLSAEEAFNAAALTADAGQPDLPATTVDPQLGWSERLLQRMRAGGLVARGPVDYGEPRVVALSSDHATVRDCVHDAEIVVVAASGRPVPGVPGQVDDELFDSTMELTVTGWKLSSQTVGVAQCS